MKRSRIISLILLLALACGLITVEADTASVIDFAYARYLKYYTVYYAFDNDTMTVYRYLSGDSVVEAGSFSGASLGNISMSFIYDGEEMTSSFRRSGGEYILTDENGFDWSYVSCTADEAEDVINEIGYKFGSAKVISKDATVTVVQGCNARASSNYEGAIIMWIHEGETYKYLDEANGWTTFRVIVPDLPLPSVALARMVVLPLASALIVPFSSTEAILLLSTV